MRKHLHKVTLECHLHQPYPEVTLWKNCREKSVTPMRTSSVENFEMTPQRHLKWSPMTTHLQPKTHLWLRFGISTPLFSTLWNAEIANYNDSWKYIIVHAWSYQITMSSFLHNLPPLTRHQCNRYTISSISCCANVWLQRSFAVIWLLQV